jgi:hypothetical protein
MKLLTKEILARLPQLYAQEHAADPLVHVKFFTPWSFWTWYVLEGTQQVNSAVPGDWRFYGLVDGMEREKGYFMLSQLESVRGPGGLTIERDIHFKPCPLSTILNQLDP